MQFALCKNREIFLLLHKYITYSHERLQKKNKSMQVINFSETNSILNQYLAEIRDVNYQQNRLLFRNNITRVGEMMAYEIS